MPQQMFGSEYLHRDIETMAAAYFYHVAKDHPFLDGNKRASIAFALAFLRMNGHAAQFDVERLTNLVLDVATGTASKDDVARFFRESSRTSELSTR